MTNGRELPTYTKIGFRITIVLLLVIGAFLLRNCAKAIHYGTTTPEQTVEAMFERGYEDGRRKAAGQEAPPPYEGDNLILKKAYRRGFRAGWDAGRAPNRK